MNKRHLLLTVVILLGLLCMAGPGHALAGVPATVGAWGENEYGQLSVPGDLGPVSAIDAGDFHSLALKVDGTVVAWGENSSGQSTVPAGLSGVVAVSAGWYHSLALKSDGTIVAWGDNWNGQINVPAGLTDVVAISAANHHSLALKSDGTVVAWGCALFGDGQCTVPDGLTDVVAVSAGGYHSLALKSDGTVACWGRRDEGQCSPPPGLSNVVAISAGLYHSLALKSDGTVVAWGGNWNGQSNVPDGLSNVAAVSAGGYHSLALKSDGTVACWGRRDEGQCSPPPGLSNILAVSAGNMHSLAMVAVGKTPATVTLSNLEQTYDGQPKPVAVTTEPAGLSVDITYGGLGDPPKDAGSYAVAATINDPLFEGTASGTLTIQPKAASVTPHPAGKVYGEVDPALTGTLEGFLPKDIDCARSADCIGAKYWREEGEEAGEYPIHAESWTMSAGSDPRDNYFITINPATFSIAPRPVEVTAHAQTKNVGEPDPALTYQITNGSLALADAFGGTLARDAGETPGVYPILQGTLALNSNYTLHYVGANLTINAPPNTAPVAAPGGPYLGAINTAIPFAGSASSDADGDPLTYAWAFGDGSSGAGITPMHAYAAAGIYDVCLTVHDGKLASTPACTLAVVYDPSTGFVTGGGWILSPAGAYKPDAGLSGKASFGFVSKYKKGASVPEGSTQFTFDTAGFEFNSTAFEWLLISKDQATAQFKGAGAVNGALAPNGKPYKFMLWAGDGTGAGGADTFRIRIWWEDAGVERAVYDNGFDQAIGGGNIVVHTGKVKGAALEEEVSGANSFYLPLINGN